MSTSEYFRLHELRLISCGAAMRVACRALFLTTIAGGSLLGQGATGTIRVQPNLATQAREGFTVCVGTAQNRTQYGSKVTPSTGIVTFTGVPAGQGLVVTVDKTGFVGREQGWSTPATGATSDVVVPMFGGIAGPSCGTASSSASSVQITVAPASSATPRDGFFVCVGNSTNRAAYGGKLTPVSGTVTFQNLPASGMVKATIVGPGHTGVERDWYPSGSAVALTLPITAGSGGFTCPGYTPSTVSTLRVTVRDNFSPAAGVYVCVLGGGRVLAATRQTDSRGQVAFAGLDHDSGNWLVLAGLGTKRARVDISGSHVRDTAINMSLAQSTVAGCAGTPPPPEAVVSASTATTAVPLTVSPPPSIVPTRKDYVINGTVAWNAARKYGFTFHPVRAASDWSNGFVTEPLDGVATYFAMTIDRFEPTWRCTRLPGNYNPLQPGARCIVGQVVGGNMSVTPVINSARTSQTVSFQLYGGKKLSPGWVVKSVNLSNGTWTAQPQAGTSDLRMQFTLTSYGANPAIAIVRSITLEGPANAASFEDAFRNAQNR